MPRQVRLDVPGALHHIMVRASARPTYSVTIRTGPDSLNAWASRSWKGRQCTVYAWALMTNHVHILFKSGKQGISSVMRRLLTWYAQYYNHRHTNCGSYRPAGRREYLGHHAGK